MEREQQKRSEPISQQRIEVARTDGLVAQRLTQAHQEQTASNGSMFDRILEAFAEDPERWDGLS